MVSILIPTYNYSIVPLVQKLHREAICLKFPFEIIVMDDASEISYQKENSAINELEHCTYDISEKNQGRTATRNLLSQQAIYSWLLFLDADVLPKKENFLSNYIENSTNYDIVFGGISYSEKAPSTNEILRWKYGKKREGKSVDVRKKMPYLSIISQSFLIKKELFNRVNPSAENGYGMDVLFSANLEASKAAVLHINNVIVHYGLEGNTSFIHKTKKGIDTMIRLEREGKIEGNYRPIQRAFQKLKKYKSVAIFQFGFSIFQPIINKNLLSSNPSLFLFDLYKLNYYIETKKSHD